MKNSKQNKVGTQLNINAIFILLALLTGALIPIQAATNAAFSKNIGSPILTGIMVFIVGLIAILFFALITKTPLPELSNLKNAPLYSYAGGLIVAIYVIMITILVPELSVATSIGLIVTGQIICAVIIDHFGFFGTAVRTIDTGRAIGALLMIAGIYLVMKK